MTYERITAEELVRSVFGSFEECIDEVLISTEIANSQMLIPYYGGGELSPNSPDWLLFALLEDIAEWDARAPKATVPGNRSHVRKARWKSPRFHFRLQPQPPPLL